MSLRLPILPSLRQLLDIYGLKARHQLSQNFLLDTNITRSIVKHLGKPLDGCLILEIGPGPGSLTRSILDAGGKHVLGIERDERFRPVLQQLSDASCGRYKTTFGDAMNIEQITWPLISDTFSNHNSFSNCINLSFLKVVRFTKDCWKSSFWNSFNIADKVSKNYEQTRSYCFNPVNRNAY